MNILAGIGITGKFCFSSAIVITEHHVLKSYQDKVTEEEISSEM